MQRHALQRRKRDISREAAKIAKRRKLNHEAHQATRPFRSLARARSALHWRFAPNKGRTCRAERLGVLRGSIYFLSPSRPSRLRVRPLPAVAANGISHPRPLSRLRLRFARRGASSTKVEAHVRRVKATKRVLHNAIATCGRHMNGVIPPQPRPTLPLSSQPCRQMCPFSRNFGRESMLRRAFAFAAVLIAAVTLSGCFVIATKSTRRHRHHGSAPRRRLAASTARTAKTATPSSTSSVTTRRSRCAWSGPKTAKC